MGKAVSGAVTSSTAFTMPPTQDVKGKRRVVDELVIEVATSPPPPTVVCALDTFSLSERLDALGTKLKNGASATGHGDRACALADELHSLRDELRETVQVIAGSSSSAGQMSRELGEYPRVDDESVRPLVRQTVRAVRDIADLAGKELARTQESFWTSIKKACAGILFGIMVSSSVAAAAGPMAAVAVIAPVVCAALAVLGAVITVGAVGYRLYTAEKQRGEKQKTLQEIQRHAGELLEQLRPADTSKVRQPQDTGFSAGLADANSRAVVSDGFFQLRLLAAGSNKARLRLAEDLLASDTPLMDEQRRSRADQIFGALDFNSLTADHADVCTAVELCMRLMPIASPDWQLRVFQALCRGHSLPDPHPEESAAVRRHLLSAIPSVDPSKYRAIVQHAAEHEILKDADLRNWDLADLDLTRGNLQGSNFSGARLEGAIFDLTRLQGADFSGAHLEGASFGGAHLEGANFSGAHLEGAGFGQAHLESANFSGAHLEGANFSFAHLNGANLSGLSPSRTNFSGTNLRGANLSHVDVATLASWRPSGTYPCDGVDFTGVDFRSGKGPQALRELARLLTDRCRLADVELTDDQLQKAVEHFTTHRIGDEEALHHNFGHLYHAGRGVLVSINSLPAKYLPYKLQLVELLIAQLDGIMTEQTLGVGAVDPVLPSVAVFLLENPVYAQESAHIRKFMEDRKLIERVLQHGQSRLIATDPALSPAWTDAMMRAVFTLLEDPSVPVENRQQLAQRYGFAIFQVLYLARSWASRLQVAPGTSASAGADAPAFGGVEELTALAEALQAAYLNLLPKDFGLVFGETKDAYVDESLFPLFSDDSTRVLLLTDEYFERCTGSDPKWSLGSIFMRDGEEWKLRRLGKGYPIMEDLDAAPVLAGIYLSETTREAVRAGLSYLLPAVRVEQAVREMDCTRKSVQTIPWTDDGVQLELTERIDGLVEFSSSSESDEFERQRAARFRKDAYEQLRVQHRPLLMGSDGRIDPRREAYWCRCWATMLALLSSSDHFGEEFESPVAVRVLAIAMLNAAYSLSPDSSSDVLAAERHQETLRILSGGWEEVDGARRRVFSCTGNLGYHMKIALEAQAKGDPALRAIHSALIPANW